MGSRKYFVRKYGSQYHLFEFTSDGNGRPGAAPTGDVGDRGLISRVLKGKGVEPGKIDYLFAETKSQRPATSSPIQPAAPPTKAATSVPVAQPQPSGAAPPRRQSKVLTIFLSAITFGRYSRQQRRNDPTNVHQAIVDTAEKARRRSGTLLAAVTKPESLTLAEGGEAKAPEQPKAS